MNIAILIVVCVVSTAGLGLVGVMVFQLVKISHATQDVKTTGEAVHVLVNNNMGIQLALNASVTRRLANLTGDPTDSAAADAAEKLYREHVSKQAVVDSESAPKLGGPVGSQAKK